MNFEERRQRRLELGKQQEQASPKAVNGKKRELEGTVNIERCEMDGLTKSKLITTKELSNTVNKVFRGTFPEYEGCRIFVNGASVITEVFFSERGKDTDYSGGKIQLLVRKDQQAKQKDMANVIATYNQRNKVATAYDLTQPGKDALSEFVHTEFFTGRWEDQNVNWSRCVSEVAEQEMNGRRRAYIKVTIDLQRVFKKIYMDAADPKADLKFEIGLVRPIITMRDPSTGNLYTKDWLFNIVQLNQRQLESACLEAGIGMNTGDLGIMR